MQIFFFFSSRRRHTRFDCDWSSDVCSSDLIRACIAGTDPAKIWQLPDTTGLKSEIVMFGGRSAFDSALRLTGAKLVVIHTPEELQSAIGPKTAMIYTTRLGER